MDETKNVTYLLGAGASYNALPIVVNWNARLEQFHGFIKIEVPKFKALGIESDKVLGEIDEILKAAKKHATIDTYAKKLFLKNLSDSKQRLLSLKHFLGCFFSFEQTWLTNWDPLISEKGNETISRLSDQFEGQKKQVDERYDVFFATLLKEPRLELDERVNIISWNYDLQLELAYSDFNEKSNPHKKLKITPNAFGLEQETRVVKLNGSAGMFFNPEFYLAGDEGGFIPCLKNDELMQQEEFKIPSLECLLFIYSEFLNGKIFFKPLVNFAWERDRISDISFEKAQEIMKKTEVLVNIGYSFPNFNRSIDKKLLEMLPSGCKIYYQDHQDRVGGLIQRLKGLLPTEGKEFASIVPYTDLDQFFIPYEL